MSNKKTLDEMLKPSTIEVGTMTSLPKAPPVGHSSLNGLMKAREEKRRNDFYEHTFRNAYNSVLWIMAKYGCTKLDALYVADAGEVFIVDCQTTNSTPEVIAAALLEAVEPQQSREGVTASEVYPVESVLFVVDIYSDGEIIISDAAGPLLHKSFGIPLLRYEWVGVEHPTNTWHESAKGQLVNVVTGDVRTFKEVDDSDATIIQCESDYTKFIGPVEVDLIQDHNPAPHGFGYKGDKVEHQPTETIIEIDDDMMSVIQHTYRDALADPELYGPRVPKTETMYSRRHRIDHDFRIPTLVIQDVYQTNTVSKISTATSELCQKPPHRNFTVEYEAYRNVEGGAETYWTTVMMEIRGASIVFDIWHDETYIGNFFYNPTSKQVRARTTRNFTHTTFALALLCSISAGRALMSENVEVEIVKPNPKDVEAYENKESGYKSRPSYTSIIKVKRRIYLPEDADEKAKRKESEEKRTLCYHERRGHDRVYKDENGKVKFIRFIDSMEINKHLKYTGKYIDQIYVI